MTEVRLRIDKLKLRLHGLDETAASSLTSGLGEAIAGAVDVQALRQSPNRRVGRIDLGSMALTPGTTSAELRGQVATAVAGAVSKPGSTGGEP